MRWLPFCGTSPFSIPAYVYLARLRMLERGGLAHPAMRSEHVAEAIGPISRAPVVAGARIHHHTDAGH